MKRKELLKYLHNNGCECLQALNPLLLSEVVGDITKESGKIKPVVAVISGKSACYIIRMMSEKSITDSEIKRPFLQTCCKLTADVRLVISDREIQIIVKKFAADACLGKKGASAQETEVSLAVIKDRTGNECISIKVGGVVGNGIFNIPVIIIKIETCL